ncbi:TPA: hypothetical protein QCY38_001104 [Bacillus toyonensis]|nr:hypothetical protein [Bacillus toyonensis]AFU11666.1 hypothetical protein MC28_0244 [Bacillus thuringiensis MC28]OTW93684.1 hypothetical protein BK702_04625 [Bacillus thuringiensis serovar cameroun]OTX00902.1 hypothetical protein BK712_29650 [Bacillus thuringiensis serovar seoulensis]QPW49988.1 hypothetical protein G9298_20275 [Bacillus thuringiensis]MCA1043995.1 hypothetical protein [Bacillus toyonensis]
MNEMMIDITFDLIYLLSSSLVMLLLFAFFVNGYVNKKISVYRNEEK